ncbi:MAG: ABC transporter ATP-binding protein, partial [Actinomycetes bacterium]
MDNPRSLLTSSLRPAGPPRALAPGTLRRIVGFAQPHKTSLLTFLSLSMVSAVLVVATPVLAGRVVVAVVGRPGVTLVVGLAALIAVLAVIDAGVGLASRWQSSRIREGLILELRRAVLEHVQRMPVALITRTRTGALV